MRVGHAINGKPLRSVIPGRSVSEGEKESTRPLALWPPFQPAAAGMTPAPVMAGCVPAIPIGKVQRFRIGITGTRPVMTWENADSLTLAFPAQIAYSPRFAFAPAGG